MRDLAADLAGRIDTLREQWLTDDRFTAVDVMVAADASVLSPPAADPALVATRPAFDATRHPAADASRGVSRG